MTGVQTCALPISVSRDKSVKLWDVQTGKFIRTVSGERNQITSLAVSRDGKVMATGSIGRDINLMVYPLKVMFAEQKKDRKDGEKKEEQAGEENAAPKDEEAEKEGIDLASLGTTDEDVEELAYRAVSKGDAQAQLLRLEKKLNGKLMAGRYCDSADEMETLAYQILILAPYDMAAYHALVITGIIQQDLKMIYLISKIGLRALFLSGVYEYDLPAAVEAKLALWQEEVFDPARRRAGRELELEFIDCDGTPRLMTMPTELLALDIPREVLKVLASRKARVNFRHFKQVDTATFLKRIFYLIDETMIATRPRGRTEERRVGDACRSRWSPDH